MWFWLNLYILKHVWLRNAWRCDIVQVVEIVLFLVRPWAWPGERGNGGLKCQWWPKMFWGALRCVRWPFSRTWSMSDQSVTCGQAINDPCRATQPQFQSQELHSTGRQTGKTAAWERNSGVSTALCPSAVPSFQQQPRLQIAAPPCLLFCRPIALSPCRPGALLCFFTCPCPNSPSLSRSDLTNTRNTRNTDTQILPFSPSASLQLQSCTAQSPHSPPSPHSPRSPQSPRDFHHSHSLHSLTTNKSYEITVQLH